MRVPVLFLEIRLTFASWWPAVNEDPENWPATRSRKANS